VRRRLVIAVIVLGALIGGGAIPLSAAHAASPNTGTTACRDGGWRALTDETGAPFRSQGGCINWMIHHPSSLADLAGSFTGVTTYTFATHGCDLVHQVFNATYQGSAAVGEVTLDAEGCVLLDPATSTGSFTLTTGLGAVSGTFAGTHGPLPAYPEYGFDLMFSVSSGTGAFAGQQGDMAVHITWFWLSNTTMTGTITVA
jgi:hypothetical protein